jgi:hypothetical protein
MDRRKQAMIIEAKKYWIMALKYAMEGTPKDLSSSDELRITCGNHSSSAPIMNDPETNEEQVKVALKLFSH